MGSYPKLHSQRFSHFARHRSSPTDRLPTTLVRRGRNYALYVMQPNSIMLVKYWTACVRLLEHCVDCCVWLSGRLHTCLVTPMSRMVHRRLKAFCSRMQQWRVASRQMWLISTSVQSGSSVLMIHSRTTRLTPRLDVSSCDESCTARCCLKQCLAYTVITVCTTY